MFTVAITNVLITLCYIMPGFALCKFKKAVGDHLSTVSAFLVYVCSPCMVISSLTKMELNGTTLLNMLWFFLITLVLQGIFMGVTFLVFRKKFQESKYRIFTLASVMGNVGFFGLPIVKALFPNNPEVMTYSCIASVSLNMLIFTVGIFCLTGEKKDVKLSKAILNPNSLGFIAGMIICLSGALPFIPQILLDAVDLMGKMTTPVCMFILGVRLASVSFKKLFLRPFVYLTCLAKLVIFPLFCYAAVYFLPLDGVLKASVLVLMAAPCASTILGMAEMYKSETELSANSVLLSTLLCAITIPILVLIL